MAITPADLQSMFDSFSKAFAIRQASEVAAAQGLGIAAAQLASAQSAVVTAQAADDAAAQANLDATASTTTLFKAVIDALAANDVSVFWTESGISAPTP